MEKEKAEIVAEEKEIKKKDKTPMEKYIGISIGVIVTTMILMFIVVIAMAVFNGHLNPETGETSLLASGIAIIAIAIAVWAGLNITNAIEREKLKKLENHIDELDKKSNTFNDIISEGNNIYRNSLIQELLKKSDYPTEKYFAEKFADMDDCELTQNLLEIEQIFNEVFNLHESSYKEDSILKNFVEKGKKIIKYIREKQYYKESINDNIKKIIELYLDYREATFNFYSGYCRKGVERYTEFLNAIKIIMEKCWNVFGLPGLNYKKDFEKIISDIEYKENFEKSMSKILQDNIKNETKRMAIFLANTIGEAYSKIAEDYKELINKDDSNGFKITLNDIKECALKAIFYCSYAVKSSEDDAKKREVYYRNLGCAYERYDRILASINKKTMSIEYASLIVESYSKALHIAINNTKEINDRIHSVYYTTLSYFEKYFRFKIFNSASPQKTIENVSKSGSILNAISNLINLDVNYDWLKKYQVISEVAINDRVKRGVFFSLNGLAYTYIIIFILAKDKTITETYGNDAGIYMNKISVITNTLKYMYEKPDGFTEDLKTRYDVLKEYIGNHKENEE